MFATYKGVMKMNNVTLIGRLVKNVELRKTVNGTSICNFTLAVNRKAKQQGQPEADFIGCMAFNRIADLMYQYLHKGSLIGVEGRIQTSAYDNKKGQTVYKTHVVVDSVQFLEPKGNTNSQLQQSSTNTCGQSNYQNAPSYWKPQESIAHEGNLTEQAEKNAYCIPDNALPF